MDTSARASPSTERSQPDRSQEDVRREDISPVVVVAFFKRKEHEDFYDRDTNFAPFSLKV